MNKIVVRLERRVKMRVRRLRRETRDKGLAVRCQVVLLADKGRTRAAIAEGVGCSVSWVGRVLARWRDFGIPGLYDRREDNGTLKLDEWFLAELVEVVDGSPRDHGYLRPTWTQELLSKVMHLRTGVKVHAATMSRALAMIKARLGRPKPTVGCPWPAWKRNRRLREILATPEGRGPDEAAVYLDEVDIHLNPKVGLDWMNRGTQKTVLTPGKNEKRYLCGALDADTGLLAWVRSAGKNSLLFIAMLQKLANETYAGKRVVHVVLDNYRIHSSKAVQAAVAGLGGRVKLHFLPPYCPDHNKIERVWLDLHANVTRNHTHADMDGLMRDVSRYLMTRNCRKRAKLSKAA